MSHPRDPVGRLSASLKESFERGRVLLSFAEYIDLVRAQPTRLARNAAQYALDALQACGATEIAAPGGTTRRLHAFDAPFDEGADKVVGNEATQQELVRALDHFVRERRINRLILVHGPNGSAKSSFVGVLMRALEAYSHTDEGALYRFNWVFPSQQTDASRIGFDKRVAARDATGSYAFLDERFVDTKLTSDHNDNPLFLLPREERTRLLEEALGDAAFVVSDTIRRGELGARSRAVFDALLGAYRGDFAEVCRHVQVERFTISKRYRRGAVTVEPQLRVDAAVRQLTADRSLGALPRVLQSQTLFEAVGPLVEANRGVVEYNDLLKRPMDMNKYLLATSEKGTVSLETSELHLDALLVATANEAYLDAFKQSADWPSYKGRIALIRMPYLVDYRAEQAIYDDQLAAMRPSKPVAPHTTFAAALWAVLTRLRRPKVDDLPRSIAKLVEELSPVDKAMLYGDGSLPAGLTGEQAQQLRLAIPRIAAAAASVPDYEGRFGASPREMKTVILDAVHGPHPTVSPLHVFAAIRRLIADPSVYEWLQLESEGAYRQPDAFVDTVRRVVLDRIEREVREATGLVDATEYRRVFERYVTHANHWLRKEKLKDDATGQLVPADVRFLEDIENTLGRDEEPDLYRSRLITRVAAFKIDNPSEAVDLERIFPDFFSRMRDHYFETRRGALHRLQRDFLAALDGDDSLSAQARGAVEAMRDALRSRFGYTDETAREAVGLLLRERYDMAG